MADLLAERVRVSDLRGSAAPAAGSAVLEDPTGKRRKRLRLAGRLVAAALTVWLIALVLGGVGLSPVPGVPFAHILRPAAPPAPRQLPQPAQPTASDLEPALPAHSAKTAVAPQPVHVAGQGTTRNATLQRRRAAAKRHAVAVHTMPPTAGGGQRAAAPVPTTTHVNNGRRAGAVTTITTTTTTTTPGRSGSAPGQTYTAPGRSRTTTTTTTTTP